MIRAKTGAPAGQARPLIAARGAARDVSRRRSALSRAVAADAAADTSGTSSNTKWFACIANAQFMLNDVQNESFAEQLREKTRYYREKGLDLDYFLVCDPAWLDEQHPEEAKKVQRPCVALVGQEESWIRYMKLRLDRVLFVEVEGTKEEVTKCGSAVPDFEKLDANGKTWNAPYTPYAPGWWDVFMPGKVDK